MPKLPKILKTETIANSRLFEIEQVDLRFENGVERSFERINGYRGQAVMIVPMLDPETVLLVREYRVGSGQYEISLPGGLLEKDEDIFSAANREMKEEIGYGAHEFQTLKSLTAAPAYMTTIMHIVLANDLYQEQLIGDEPEDLEVIAWKISELEQLTAREDCSESRTIAALYMVWDKLNKRYHN